MIRSRDMNNRDIDYSPRALYAALQKSFQRRVGEQDGEWASDRKRYLNARR